MRPELLRWLRCASCGGALGAVAAKNGEAPELTCGACGMRVPVVNAIPRFVRTPSDENARRTQASFGYEWTHFNDWKPSGAANFNDYFQGIDLESLRTSFVLDAGCGMGRHTRQVAPFADRVVAVDFSLAIEQAARNTAELPNVDCIQGDLLALPLADGAFDFVYSLGVLHHIDDTEGALRSLVRKVRPGGRVRVYLYWKRHGWSGRLLTCVTAARRVTTRLPFPVLRLLCAALSAVLFVGVVMPYRLLSAVGVQAHHEWPLFIYSKYPFKVLYNDQFDRFSAPIEKRYDPEDVLRLLERAGLERVEVRPCAGWIGDGIRPA